MYSKLNGEKRETHIYVFILKFFGSISRILSTAFTSEKRTGLTESKGRGEVIFLTLYTYNKFSLSFVINDLFFGKRAV